jgi:hypothetical protein
MRPRLSALLLACAVSATSAAEPNALVSGFQPVVRNALVTGIIYSFAVLRNGNSFCLPPNDTGLDIIWKEVAEKPDLFTPETVWSVPNRLPEEAFLKLLRELFPCH